MTTENTQLTPDEVAAAAIQAAAEKLVRERAEKQAAEEAAAKAEAERLAAEKAAAEAAASAKPAAFEPTGDPALDVSLGYAASQGLTPDSPEIAAARTGDFSKLEEFFKSKNAPGWEAQVALAKDAYQRMAAAVQEADKKVFELITSEVKGADRWREIQEWAKTAIKPEDRDEINTTLARGGFAARAMARHLDAEYTKATGRQAKDPSPGGTTSGGAADTALTSKEFGRLSAAIAMKHIGRDPTSLPEYKALVARRAAARAAGVP